MTLAGATRAPGPAFDWEGAWAPYDEATYAEALSYLTPQDVALDLGAGDLRFARRAASRASRVVAIEGRAELLGGERPANLTVICGDALVVPYPPGITVAVLLMRHCRHFAAYVARLRQAGCWRMVTNARWGLGVEHVTLNPALTAVDLQPGWYACLCGAVGFWPGPPAAITAETLLSQQALATCPACQPGQASG